MKGDSQTTVSRSTIFYCSSLRHFQRHHYQYWIDWVKKILQMAQIRGEKKRVWKNHVNANSIHPYSMLLLRALWMFDGNNFGITPKIKPNRGWDERAGANALILFSLLATFSSHIPLMLPNSHTFEYLCNNHSHTSTSIILMHVYLMCMYVCVAMLCTSHPMNDDVWINLPFDLGFKFVGSVAHQMACHVHDAHSSSWTDLLIYCTAYNCQIS